jgi:hypothetical protein
MRYAQRSPPSAKVQSPHVPLGWALTATVWIQFDYQLTQTSLIQLSPRGKGSLQKQSIPPYWVNLALWDADPMESRMIHLPPPQRHAWRLRHWACVAAAAGAVELVIVMLVLGWNAPPPVDAMPSLSNQRAAQQSAAAGHAVVAPPREWADAPRALPRPKVNIANPGRDRTQVEICGFGTVSLRPDDPYPFQGIPRALRESALDTAEALMLASSDIQVRTAALWMGLQRGKRDARARVEQMARLASGSQDPVVYALAIAACKGWASDDYGACQLISRAQWAYLDPDNAVPWLEVAAQARHDNDPDAEETALRRAAHARHTNTREGLLPTLVDRALGPHVTPLQRTLALSESWSAQAMWTVSHAPHLNAAAAKAVGPPTVDLDLSCDSVDRIQDWMRQQYVGSDVPRPHMH